MPISYSEHNLRRIFNAPQFTRSRHRFRGSRESEKINLEIGQMYYSVHKLHKAYDEFQHRFTNRALGILEGQEMDFGFDEEPAPIEGLQDIAARLDILQRRVNALEA